MNKTKNIILGDRVLWVALALLSIFSFLPVFSASSNLTYVVGQGTPWGHLLKHFIVLFFGFGLMYGLHKIPYQYFKGISILALPLVILLLIYTASQGNLIAGANANRWIRIPIVGLSFQTSTLASIVLLAYVAHLMSKENPKLYRLKTSILPLWLPVILVTLLILPANLSTAAVLFFMVLILVFLGGYPIKYLMGMLGVGLFMALLFVLLAKAYPDWFPNRIDTWINRIENFASADDNVGNYQIERAKTAIATGGLLGLGAGKSVMKNFLPQSSSDFIYAIIVEEFGLVGGTALILLYLVVLFRIVVIAHKSETVYGKLLVLGLGLPIIIQAFINMAVALQVFPVTGQTLPLISSGGTAAWMTCIAFGMILSVSASQKIESNSLEDADNNNENPLTILSETL
ncbi:MAG: FtsW/RodA/SpoVE family cell cycle protein [Flavobacteriaceae bacterium]|nr:FtsW/RodA/SpoVE family cell cycle protein [Flavobacteriaceae bacterium]MDB2314121.1 FtsW/RodA/SpoVE family cell cycle protein [Flavobacteriaceae bacterium]MDC3238495.1 FtsW/RodA/SpoVE family cell cycle protein [Flavobacteriaceae bacterium]